MKIARGVEMLKISADVMGKPSTIHPALIWDSETTILVDTGFPGQLPLIREAIEKAGFTFLKLNKIIITHHDMDHIGSLSSLVKELPEGIEVLAHLEEKPYIQGEKRPIKMAQLEARLDSLPDEMKARFKNFKANFENLKTRVDKTLADGEELPCCGGITVIHTPGHTPGHICLYLKQSKTLIGGDALFVESGMLVQAPPSYNFDTDLSIKSIKKLTKYDIETVICYHGGLYKENVNQRIAELANG